MCEGVAARCVRRPWLTVAVVLVVVAVPAAGLARLGIDAAGDRFLPADAASRVALDDLHARFGADDTTVVLARATGPEPAASPVSALDPIEQRFRSDVPHIAGLQRVADPGNRWAAMIVTAEVGDPKRATDHARAARSVTDEIHTEGVDLAVAGTQVNMTFLADEFAAQTGLFTTLAIIVAFTLLTLGFRRLLVALLPIALVAVAVLVTLGAMGWADEPLTAVTQILPAFLIATGVASAVHLLIVFLRELDRGAARPDAAVASARKAGPALFYSAITTALGLGGFLLSSVPPVGAFGWTAPLGVLVTFWLSMTLLPALATITPLRARTRDREVVTRPAHARLSSASCWSARHPGLVLSVVGVVVVLSVVGLTRIQVVQDPVAWFPPDHPLRHDLAAVEDVFGGSLRVDVVVDTTDPAVLGAVSESITNTALEGRPVKLLLPEVSSDGAATHLPVLVPSVSILAYHQWASDLDHQLQPLAAGTKVTVTGTVVVLSESFNELLPALVSSYWTELLLVAAVMMIAVGSIRRGLLAMVANLVPVIFTVGLAGWLGVPLDAYTLLVGGILIGLAVDDIIHLTRGLVETDGGDLEGRLRAIWGSGGVVGEENGTSTGRGVVLSSLVLGGGFLVYAASPLGGLRAFAILLAIGIAAALASDVFVLPAVARYFGPTSAARRGTSGNRAKVERVVSGVGGRRREMSDPSLTTDDGGWLIVESRPGSRDRDPVSAP